MSWEEKSPDYRPLTDPPNEKILGWWRSGEAGDGSYSTMCAWVDAASMLEATAAVLKDWPGTPVWRFSNAVEADWIPGDRFPLSDWSKKRAGLA